MIISIHQPDYIPWLGYYYKMAHSDIFVYLDEVQFSNEAAHNFNVIKTSQGEYRLKIPVSYNFGDPINCVITKDQLIWKKKHLKTLEMNYSRAPFFKEIFPKFSDILMISYPTLSDLNISINQFICDEFGIHPIIRRSSEFDLHSKRETKVLDICETLGGSIYLSGNGARIYQKESNFQERNIELRYLKYKSIEYKQVWKGFMPNLSVLDYIFNCGFDWKYVEDAVEELNTNGNG